jgi:hypothetical protein
MGTGRVAPLLYNPNPPTNPAQDVTDDKRRRPAIGRGMKRNLIVSPWSIGSSEIFIAGSALLMLLAAQWILCRIVPGGNYYTLDGKMAQSVVLIAFKFGAYFDVTNLNPIQGAGSQLLPKNVWANPAFWPFAVFEKEAATDLSALIALACFASAAYIMMRCFDVPVLPSAVAAQLCIVIFAPTVLITGMPANFCATPGDAVVYAPYMIALGLLARLPSGSWHTFGLTAAGIAALVFYSVYCDPLWTMLAAISWAMPFAVVTFGSLHLKTITARVAAVGCCLALLALTGTADYLYTVSRYSQRVYFAEALDRARGPELVSVMTYSANMKSFYLACALGWLLGFVTLRGRARALVLAATTAFFVWIVYGVAYLLLNAAWVLPIPAYLEHCLFALYVAGAGAGYWGMLRTVALLSARVAAPLVGRVGAISRGRTPATPSDPGGDLRRPLRSRALARVGVALLCVAAFPAQIVVSTLNNPQAKANVPDKPWPQEPELVQFLTQNIGLAVGQPFRGTINFLSFDPNTVYTIESLWSRSVPTLYEYSQLVSPTALYFIHALFRRDVSTLVNHFNMFWADGAYSPAYWGALQMFGVRYSAERTLLPDPVSPGSIPITKPHRPVEPGLPFDTWYIYELPRPNIGNYSPTEVVTAQSGAEIMAMLGQSDFDFTRRVVLTAALDRPLVPARDMRLSVIRGGLHVSGRSDGTSLVVLPQQFSHCLRARDGNVRFVRANLMMAGMIFSGAVDSDIMFDYGLFSPGCRRADVADLKQLDLKIDRRVPHLSGDRLFPNWDDALIKLGPTANAVFH